MSGQQNLPSPHTKRQNLPRRVFCPNTPLWLHRSRAVRDDAMLAGDNKRVPNRHRHPGEGRLHSRVAQLETRQRYQNPTHCARDGQKCPCDITLCSAPVEMCAPAKTVAGATIARLCPRGAEVVPVVTLFAAAAPTPEMLAAMKRINHHRLWSTIHDVRSACLSHQRAALTSRRIRAAYHSHHDDGQPDKCRNCQQQQPWSRLADNGA